MTSIKDMAGTSCQQGRKGISHSVPDILHLLFDIGFYQFHSVVDVAVCVFIPFDRKPYR